MKHPLKLKNIGRAVIGFGTFLGLIATTTAQIGTRFPSEKKIVPDPVTGIPLTFLTSKPAGDSKIYQTHHQWTADGKWVIFRSNRVHGQAMAVNEETGTIVQVTEGGYAGMLCLADHSMSLYFLRIPTSGPAPVVTGAEPAYGSAPATAKSSGAGTSERGPRERQQTGPAQIIKVDLGTLFADSESGKLRAPSVYEKVCGTIPMEWGAGGDMALDCTEEFAYFRVGKEESAKHLAPDTKPESAFGPRHMGAGPSGLGKMNLKTGEVSFIVAVPFQIGHVQTNPWVSGEIVFCWETGGKSPQRTWTVLADGTGLRPLYPEAPYEWITHEAVITKDEVAIAILAHRKPGVGVDKPDPWGPSGTDEHPTGLGIVNLRNREMRIIGQVPMGNPGKSVWHVNGSPDGRWACADDFLYRLWLIDRHTGEMIMLADLGHMTTAADHIHPTFSADSSKIEIQCAMLSENKRTLNVCVVPVPDAWLKRTYSDRIVP
jgi:oligogalacturonide lyase